MSSDSALSDRDTLLLLRRDVTQLITLVERMSGGVSEIEKRVTQIEHRFAMSDQALSTLRQEVTAARLESTDARRTATGVGKSLDDFRDTQAQAQARLSGQVSVVHWVGGIVVTIVIALIIGYLSGVLGL